MALAHFVLVTWVLPTLLPRLLPFYTKLDKLQKGNLENDLACCTHHLVVVPASMYCLYLQAMTPLGQEPDYSLMVPVVCLTMGYFVADFIMLLPRFVKLQSMDFFIHHIVGIALVDIGLRNSFGARWVPWFLLTEITTIVFTGCKLLMKAGKKESTAYKMLAALFTLLFLLVRVLLLPVASYWLSWGHAKDAQRMGVRVVLPPILCAMQVYWFGLILVKVFPMAFGGASATKAVDPGVPEDGKNMSPEVKKGQ